MGKSPEKAPRFFCDNCDTEVDLDVRACPNCGRLFVSVRCPACGFSGDEKNFSKGCPNCGYSAIPKKKPRPRKKKVRAHTPLPLWLYILSIGALLCMFTLLFTMLVR